MPWSCLVALLALEIGACADDMRRDVVLVEAEAFADCGGWSVDQQLDGGIVEVANESVEVGLHEMEGVRPWDHVEEFLEACKKGNPELCGSCPNYAAPLTEALLIGCISLRFPGRVLEFSPERMQFTNCAEANAFLKAPSRGAWDFAAVQRERFSLWF